MEETKNPHASTAEIIANAVSSKRKVYSDKVIYKATFAGGPLAAAYMMASNFRLFGDKAKAHWCWFYAWLFTIGIMVLVYYLPENSYKAVPGATIPIIYGGITRYLSRRYQGRNIEAYLKAGGQPYSKKRLTWIGIIGLIILFFLIFLAVTFKFFVAMEWDK